MTDFVPFPKIPRLNREIVVTEKIDGTNAAINIEMIDASALGEAEPFSIPRVTCQSRNRIITPLDDNYGFARWVEDNSAALIEVLGEGLHYGEWWGSGIQRRYGLTGDDKRFSLFNVSRWKETDFSSVPGLGVVPILYEGAMDQIVIDWIVEDLGVNGSIAAPGFMNPEGVIIFHTAARSMFKVTCEDDEKPKGQAA